MQRKVVKVKKYSFTEADLENDFKAKVWIQRRSLYATFSRRKVEMPKYTSSITKKLGRIFSLKNLIEFYILGISLFFYYHFKECVETGSANSLREKGNSSG